MKPEAHSLEEVIALAAANGRVCPMPDQWNRLYQMLPETRRSGAGWQPALPLILAAWHDTPAVLKIARLREHIEWAAENGALGPVHKFLSALPEDKWHHLDD